MFGVDFLNLPCEFYLGISCQDNTDGQRDSGSWVKVIVAKPDNLSSISGIHVVEVRGDF